MEPLKIEISLTADRKKLTVKLMGIDDQHMEFDRLLDLREYLMFQINRHLDFGKKVA